MRDITMDNNTTSNTKDNVEKKPMVTSLNDAIEYYKDVPEPATIWRGITEGDIGFVLGRSKTGKTVFCENLGIQIAARKNNYLGSRLNSDDKKVLFVSIEEHDLKSFKRNGKQRRSLSASEQQLLGQNFFVMKNLPQYLDTAAKRKLLAKAVEENNIDVVIIDSLSRLYFGGRIEESEKAQEIMGIYRKFAEELDITLIIIHHSPKLPSDKPMTINDLAGSRFIGQECNFVIGINSTPDNRRYIKDIAYRYSKEDNDHVTEFSIDDNLNTIYKGKAPEYKILKSSDGRTDDTNRNVIYDYALKHSEEGEDGSNYIKSGELYKKVQSLMSRKTYQDNLSQLTGAGKLEKIKRGLYKVIKNPNPYSPQIIEPTPS